MWSTFTRGNTFIIPLDSIELKGLKRKSRPTNHIGRFQANVILGFLNHPLPHQLSRWPTWRQLQLHLLLLARERMCLKSRGAATTGFKRFLALAEAAKDRKDGPFRKLFNA